MNDSPSKHIRARIYSQYGSFFFLLVLLDFAPSLDCTFDSSMKVQINKAVQDYLWPLLWITVSILSFVYIVSLCFEIDFSSLRRVELNSLSQWLLVGAVVLLIPLNWGIEVLKWRFSMKDLHPLSWAQSAKATLAGASISMWMPNRIGEYVGKLFYLPLRKKADGLGASLLVSYTQFIANLLLGVLVLLPLANRLGPELYNIISIGLPAAFVLIILAGLFIVKARIKIGKRNPLHVVKGLINLFQNYPLIRIVQMIGISMLRFAVFSVQFALLLRLFGAENPFSEMLLFIPLIFALQTVIPASAISGLGIRGALSVYFLSIVGMAEAIILAGTYTLWLVNVLFPGLVGYFFLIKAPHAGRIKVRFKKRLGWVK